MGLIILCGCFQRDSPSFIYCIILIISLLNKEEADRGFFCCTLKNTKYVLYFSALFQESILEFSSFFVVSHLQIWGKMQAIFNGY